MSARDSTGSPPVTPSSVVVEYDPRQMAFEFAQSQRPEQIRNELGLLTETELARSLEVTVETLGTWRGLGTGPSFTKPGKTVFYRCEDVKAWLDAHVRQPKETK